MNRVNLAMVINSVAWPLIGLVCWYILQFVSSGFLSFVFVFSMLLPVALDIASLVVLVNAFRRIDEVASSRGKKTNAPIVYIHLVAYALTLAALVFQICS